MTIKRVAHQVFGGQYKCSSVCLFKIKHDDCLPESHTEQKLYQLKNVFVVCFFIFFLSCLFFTGVIVVPLCMCVVFILWLFFQLFRYHVSWLYNRRIQNIESYAIYGYVKQQVHPEYTIKTIEQWSLNGCRMHHLIIWTPI